MLASRLDIKKYDAQKNSKIKGKDNQFKNQELLPSGGNNTFMVG